jgi:hypothetical protein
MPELIVISVALLIDQESVEAWPRSMLDGSAAKLLMAGRAAGGGGGAVGVTAGGGGGGGGGTFFLQADANTTSTKTNVSVAILDTYDLLSFILSSLLFCYNAHDLVLIILRNTTAKRAFRDTHRNVYAIDLLSSKQVFRCFLA